MKGEQLSAELYVVRSTSTKFSTKSVWSSKEICCLRCCFRRFSLLIEEACNNCYLVLGFILSLLHTLNDFSFRV